jgi:hypothetical protein
MTDEHFTELLNGPLSHPIAPFTISRLVMALRYVLERTGKAGADALDEYCRERQAQDERNAWGG